MPYYTRSYNPYVGVTDPLYAIPRVQEVNQKDAELAFNEREMAAYLAAEAARNPNLVLDRNAAARQKYAAMVERNKRLNQDPTFQPGVGIPQPITNVTEVGPGGYQPPKPLPPLSTMEVNAPAYQPGYRGGLDFANPANMAFQAPDNKYTQSLVEGLKQGSEAARDQGLMSQAREGLSSFFGGVGDVLNTPAVKRILAIMARPEFQSSEGIAAGVAEAAYGLKQDELKAQKVQREEQRLANEAAQLQFLNKLKIAQAAREQRALELREEEAAKTKGTALPTSKEFLQGAKQLTKRIAKDYIEKESGFKTSKDTVAKEITAEAMSIIAASGNTKTLRQAIIEAVAVREGRVPSSGSQSARPGVKERG